MAENFEDYANRLDSIRSSLVTPADEKVDKIQQRIAEKSSRLGVQRLAQHGFAAPLSNIIPSNAIYSIDGDTYRVDDRGTSVRTLGVDTYESSKPNYSEWIKNPNMRTKMDEQVNRLSAELGHPVTYSDVFAAGDAQKAAAKDYTTQALPSLLQETLLTNENTKRMRNGDIVNYGRDLGHLATVGGLYTKPDGSVGDGSVEVLGSNMEQAVADNLRYKTNKYSTTAPTSNPYGTLLDKPQDEGRGALEQASNFVSGIAQGALTTGVLDTVDFIGEATGIGDLGTEEEKAKMAEKVTRYDDKYSQAYMEENKKILAKNLHEIDPKDKGWFDNLVEDFSGKDGALNNINKIVSNMDGKDFGEVMSNAFANTDTTAYSLGMLIGMTAGTKGAGLAKVGVTGGKTAKEAVEVIKASDKLSKAEKSVAIASVMDEAYTNANMLQKTVNQIGKNSGLLTVNAGQVNNQLDDFEKNAGRPATASEKVEKYFTNLGGLLIDRTMDVGILKGAIGKETLEGLAGILKFGPKASADAVAKDIGKLGAAMLVTGKGLKGTAKVAGAAGIAAATEFPTEAVQTAIEEYNKVDYSTEEGKAQFREKAVDILNAAFAGSAGGAHMSLGGQAVSGVGTAAGVIEDKIISKAETAKAESAPTSTLDMAKTSYPEMDEEALKTAIDRLQRAKLDTTESGNVEPINRDAYIAAMEAENITTDNVAAIDNITEAENNPEQYEAIQSKAKDFDTAYNEAIMETKSFSALNRDAAEQEGSTDQYKLFMAQEAIPVMQQMMQDVIDAGAGVNKQKAMVDKINNLVVLANSPTVAELDDLVTTKLGTVDKKHAVAAVIGSSAASTEHIDKVLSNPDMKLSELEKTALEVKRNVLNYRVPKDTSSKDAIQVGVEKLVGGGVKPGVMQYIAMIEGGNEASVKQAVSGINAYRDGQAAKLATYKEALDAFDTSYGIDVEASSNTRASERSQVVDGIKLSTADITIGDKVYKANALSSVIDLITKEQKSLDSLAKLANERVGRTVKETLPEAQEGTSKPQTKVVDTNTQEEVKTSPEADIKPLDTASDYESLTANEVTRERNKLDAEYDKADPVRQQEIAAEIGKLDALSESRKGTQEATKAPEQPKPPVKEEKPSKPVIEDVIEDIDTTALINEFEKSKKTEVAKEVKLFTDSSIASIAKGIKENGKSKPLSTAALARAEADPRVNVIGNLVVGVEVAPGKWVGESPSASKAETPSRNKGTKESDILLKNKLAEDLKVSISSAISASTQALVRKELEKLLKDCM